MPTPRKSKRFGGDAAHQRLMMANLAASLFAAEAIVTTEAKAKALRPIAEKLITKAKKAQDEGPMRSTSCARSRASSATGDDPQARQRGGAALPAAQRRLHAHPQARHPPGRPRRHGAHRTGVTSTLVRSLVPRSLHSVELEERLRRTQFLAAASKLARCRRTRGLPPPGPPDGDVPQRALLPG